MGSNPSRRIRGDIRRMRRAVITCVARVAAAAVLAVATSGCFASIAQLDEVNEQVNLTRAEAAASDSVRATQFVQILETLRAVNDSLASLSQRMTRLRAETQAEVRTMRQEVNQILEVSGQSERRLRELREQIDTRTRQLQTMPPAPSPTASAGTNDTVTAAVPAPVETEPGPSELLQIGRDQLTRGGNRAARAAFADLLSKYPQSEYAADAQFFLAESYAADKSNAAADSAYARVVTRYPDSPRAPTALYKRGVMAQTANRRTTARRLYNELTTKYPSSDEAELARERLRVMN